MDERTYGSLVRHELGSSYSALDGVPFKIGRAFRRPEQVGVPQLSFSRTAEVLSHEYTFETEEAVLAWAKARDEAVKKAAEEENERLKLKEKQKNDAELAQASVTADTKAPTSGDEPEEISVYDIPRYSVSRPNDENSQAKSPVAPKPSGFSAKSVPEPGTVLTPIPIKPSVISSVDKEITSTAEPTSKVDSQFDLAMFEAEADPFDNLELQTLNDMEELKVLLNSNSVQNSNGPSQALRENAELPESSTPAGDSSVEKAENQTDQFESGEPSQVGVNAESDTFQTSRDLNGAVSSNETTLLSCDDGEYVEITRKYKMDTDVSQNTLGITPGDKSTHLNGVSFHKPSSSLGGALHASNMNSQIYKPVLPPIVKSAHTTDNPYSPHQSVPGPKPFLTQPCNSSGENTSGLLGSPRSQSPREAGRAIPPPSGREFVTPSPPLSAQSIKPSRPAPPPPVVAKPILKTKAAIQPQPDPMSHSTGPSLAMFLGNSEQSEERSSFQSPYSRHCISTSDLIASSTTRNGESPRRNSSGISPQPWNRHTPLPPTPNISAYKSSCVQPAQTLGLTDPYSSLSRDEKDFTDKLTNMGFLRPRVARAVEKFGIKEKEVLDHLLAVDKLGEQSYAPVMVESALFTFKNDIEKAEKFLQLYSQFEELGFQRDKIHDALVSTDLQHEKALDILTA